MAFSAYPDETRDYGDHEHIIFNDVLSQFGDAYNPVSSTFTCPVAGVYVISVTATTTPYYVIRCQIMWESSIRLNALGDSVDANVYDSGSVTAIVECDAGERIWARSDLTDNRLTSGGSYRWSSFSGFLLHAY